MFDKMPELDDMTFVIIQAGNENTGSFDPINDICNKAQKANAWVHIDGAFGLWAAGSKSKKYLTHGIAKADSWSVDAHKTLNAPYDCGIVLCKHKQALVSALQNSGSYIQYGEDRDGMLYTPEMSRRARSVELWATLKFFGKKGIECLIDGLCEKARLFAELLQENSFTILNEVSFNQVLVCCENDALTSAVLKNIQSGGICWCGGSSWNNKSVYMKVLKNHSDFHALLWANLGKKSSLPVAVIRISVCSWATTSKDVIISVEAFVKARQQGIADISRN